MKAHWLIFFLALPCFCFSQSFIQGKVLTQPGKAPIAYANIGIPGTGIGTISNEDGTFTLKLPPGHLQDTLLFSAIGYSRYAIPISSLNKNQNSVIHLEEKVIALESVIVAGKKEKPKLFEMGNRYFRSGILESDSVYAGATYALLIENKFPSYNKDLTLPVYLKSANLRIFKNNDDHFKFRIRIFDVDSLTGAPDRDLMTENIITESTIQKGWVEVDLSQLQFQISKPFYIGFEWILNDQDRKNIVRKFTEFKRLHPENITTDTVLLDGKKQVRTNLNWSDFPGTSISVSPLQFSRDHYKSYVRKSSFAKWDRTVNILTARVVVSDTPSQINKVSPIIKKVP